MEFWNSLINTSMIGTDKKQIGPHDLPAELSAIATLVIDNNVIDKEEKFLQLASIAFNYRQSGVLPLHKEQVTAESAPLEEKEYCSMNAVQALKDILAEENMPLLKFWLQYCDAKDKIAPAELLPALLLTGTTQKKLQALIAICCGKRGEWLSRFNTVWNFSSNQTAEQLWQTGTLEQRRAILTEIRTTDPAQAKEWVLQTWQQEDAATKLLFLEILAINISEADIDFIESLATEKSKKVKDEAINLLKQIPESIIVLQYQSVLQQAVTLKKEKTLLGLSTKTSLHFQVPPSIDDAVFKSGIEKLSNTKDLSDDEYIIFQLIKSVPPSFWEKQLQAKPEDIINYFQKDDTGKKMIPALVVAIKKFKNDIWIVSFMQTSTVFYIDIIPLLPTQQQNHYSNIFFNKYPEDITDYATKRENEWDIELTRNIFRHTAKNIYRYNRSFYSDHIHLIPNAIATELEKFTPSEDYLRTTWSNTSDYILKLLQLKTETIRSFNP